MRTSRTDRGSPPHRTHDCFCHAVHAFDPFLQRNDDALRADDTDNRVSHRAGFDRTYRTVHPGSHADKHEPDPPTDPTPSSTTHSPGIVVESDEIVPIPDSLVMDFNEALDALLAGIGQWEEPDAAALETP
jgi:hypothetical protein